MKHYLIFIVFFLSSNLMADNNNVIQEARKCMGKGEFKKAGEILSTALKNEKSVDPLSPVAFEIERLKRIRMDYEHTRDSLMQELKEELKNFTVEEFESWESQGRFDSQLIDGTRYYFGPSVSNLFFRYPDIRAHGINKNEETLERFKLDIIRKMKKSGGLYPMPLKFRVNMKITVKPEKVAQGKIIRCWLPYPVQYEAQSDIRLISSDPEKIQIDRPDAPIRSIYAEKVAQPGETCFNITYSYIRSGVLMPSTPPKDSHVSNDKAGLKQYLQEKEPHVLFVAPLKELASKITAGISEPIEKARAIYNWISRNILYSYAREYSTQLNISLECLKRGYGDCGESALLFITLCRINGIPARWQSGWVIYPSHTNLHDWAEIYVKPYGWIPVDPYEAVSARSISESITEKEREELVGFYFGSLDPFRLVINRDHGMPLNPPKRTFRSDTVDFQRGELEVEESNLYFDSFKYKLNAQRCD